VSHGRRIVIASLLLALPLSAAQAQSAETETSAEATGTTLEIYGFVQADVIFDFGQNDPDWFDVLRPTKLPAFANEFGANGRTHFSVRQTRFGVRGVSATPLGDLKTVFEFDLFGVGVDAGQTTFRLRYAYGELGQFGAGQHESPFMDLEMFPNSIEYWGPNAMVFLRNVQVRWMPIQGDTNLTIALERPGASGDAGIYSDRIELQDITPRFPLPDLSAGFRYGRDWGHVRVGAILRKINWDDNGTDAFDLSGDAVGWGVNLTTKLRTVGRDVVRVQVTFGKGVQNYLNDATVDIIAVENPADPARPLLGEPMGLLAVLAFYDRHWNERFTSTIGYSYLQMDNANTQTDDAFRRGEYALANLLYHPVPDMMVGAEYQWARRTNFRDGWRTTDNRIQVSFRYNFSTTTGIGQ